VFLFLSPGAARDLRREVEALEGIRAELGQIKGFIERIAEELEKQPSDVTAVLWHTSQPEEE